MPSTSPAVHTFPSTTPHRTPINPTTGFFPPSVWHSFDVTSLPFLDALHLPAFQGQDFKIAVKEDEEGGEGEGEAGEHDDDGRPPADRASVWADAHADRHYSDGQPPMDPSVVEDSGLEVHAGARNRGRARRVAHQDRAGVADGDGGAVNRFQSRLAGAARHSESAAHGSEPAGASGHAAHRRLETDVAHSNSVDGCRRQLAAGLPCARPARAAFQPKLPTHAHHRFRMGHFRTYCCHARKMLGRQATAAGVYEEMEGLDH